MGSKNKKVQESAASDRPLRRPPPKTTSKLSPLKCPELNLFALLSPEGDAKTKDPLASAKLTKPRVLEVFRSMLLLRALDERMMKHQRQGRIGFYGAATGQEAVPIAVTEALAPQDWIFPALREGGCMLHRGFSLVTYLSQIFGNSGDLLKGRNMPSHMAAREVNQVSWSSVIGPQISQAVGMAFAAKQKKDDAVALAFMGDGATSSNDFHAGLNFASVWKAPVVFVCQNNQWSISVPTTKQMASESVAQKAIAYGMPGFRVDGNDALAVHRAVKDAADAAREGKGPALIECLTYRIGAHSSSDDPRVYRDDAEVALWAARDPLARMERFLTGERLLSGKAIVAMRKEVETEVASAVSKAEKLSAPPLETLFTDVFASPDWRLREQAAEASAALES